MMTKSSVAVLLKLCVPQFGIEPFIQSKTTKVFFALTGNLKDISIPSIDNMEQELKKIVNSVSFKIESVVLYLGICSLLTVIMNLYDLVFYEDRLMLQSFFNKDSILYQITRIALCCFFVLTTIPSIFSPMQLIYLIFTSQIKVFELLDKIKKFDKKISNENVDDECILENLKIFGQHHLDIKSLHYEAFEATHLYSTVYSITGLTIGMSSLLAIFFYNAPKGPALCNFFGYISFLYGISALIQEYEDTLSIVRWSQKKLDVELWLTPRATSSLYCVSVKSAVWRSIGTKNAAL
ncbi:hypothetical protein ABEB36_000633 [Hypothenemus hampei]|uniref:Gustatory receptor n=1 Tax=Hypothenemus hampei TaxID=57062 RepID=A0ABD1FBZ7_HYPHA